MLSAGCRASLSLQLATQLDVVSVTSWNDDELVQVLAAKAPPSLDLQLPPSLNADDSDGYMSEGQLDLDLARRLLVQARATAEDFARTLKLVDVADYLQRNAVNLLLHGQQMTIHLFRVKLKEYRMLLQRLQAGAAKAAKVDNQLHSTRRELQRLEADAEAQREMQETLEGQVAERHAAVQRQREVADLAERQAAEIEETQRMASDRAEEQLAQARPTLNRALTSLATIDKAALSEIRRYQRPPVHIMSLLAAISIVMREPEDWASIKAMLAEAQFIQRVTSFDPSLASPRVIARLHVHVKSPDFDVERICNISGACGCLCDWVLAMDEYLQCLVQVRPLLAAAEESAQAARRARSFLLDLRNEQHKLAQLHAGVEHARLQCLNDRDALKKRCKDTAQLVRHAEGLLHEIAEVLHHWQARERELESELSALPGNVILSAMQLSLLGPFPARKRPHLQSIWRSRLLHHGLVPSLEPNRAYQGALFSLEHGTDELRTWVRNGLPRSTLAIENASAIQSQAYPLPPLVIDIDGAALAWLERQEQYSGLHTVSCNDPSVAQMLEGARAGEVVLVTDVGAEVPLALLRSLSQMVEQRAHQRMTVQQRDAASQSADGRPWARRSGDSQSEATPRSSADMEKQRGRALQDGDAEREEDGEHDDAMTGGARVYLITKVNKLNELSPELLKLVCIVRFDIPMSVVEDQLLGIILRHMGSGLEQRRNAAEDCLLEQTSAKNDASEKALQAVLDISLTQIFEDDDLVTELEECNLTISTAVQEDKEAKATIEEVTPERLAYSPLAVRGVTLYRWHMWLTHRNPMYAVPLADFMVAMHRHISTLPQREPPETQEEYLASCVDELVARDLHDTMAMLSDADGAAATLLLLCILHDEPQSTSSLNRTVSGQVGLQDFERPDLHTTDLTSPSSPQVYRDATREVAAADTLDQRGLIPMYAEVLLMAHEAQADGGDCVPFLARVARLAVAEIDRRAESIVGLRTTASEAEIQVIRRLTALVAAVPALEHVLSPLLEPLEADHSPAERSAEEDAASATDEGGARAGLTRLSIVAEGESDGEDEDCEDAAEADENRARDNVELHESEIDARLHVSTTDTRPPSTRQNEDTADTEARHLAQWLMGIDGATKGRLRPHPPRRPRSAPPQGEGSFLPRALAGISVNLQLLVVVVFRSDLLHDAETHLLEGLPLTRDAVFAAVPTLDDLYRRSGTSEPVLLISHDGQHWAGLLRAFAARHQMLPRLHEVALGPGLESTAFGTVERARERGDWVLIHNLHMATGEQLEQLKGRVLGHQRPLAALADDDRQRNVKHAAPTYRLWLLANPSPVFPVPLLNACVRAALGNSRWLRDHMLSSFFELGGRALDDVSTASMGAAGGLLRTNSVRDRNTSSRSSTRSGPRRALVVPGTLVASRTLPTGDDHSVEGADVRLHVPQKPGSAAKPSRRSVESGAVEMVPVVNVREQLAATISSAPDSRNFSDPGPPRPRTSSMSDASRRPSVLTPKTPQRPTQAGAPEPLPAEVLAPWKRLLFSLCYFHGLHAAHYATTRVSALASGMQGPPAELLPSSTDLTLAASLLHRILLNCNARHAISAMQQLIAEGVYGLNPEQAKTDYFVRDALHRWASIINMDAWEGVLSLVDIGPLANGDGEEEVPSLDPSWDSAADFRRFLGRWPLL
jgi:hypothetical protein